MVYFKTKNPIWGKSWSVLQWMRLVNCMAIWSKLLPFRIFHGHLVYFVFVLVYMSRFGMLYQENLATLPARKYYTYRGQSYNRCISVTTLALLRTWVLKRTYVGMYRKIFKNTFLSVFCIFLQRWRWNSWTEELDKESFVFRLFLLRWTKTLRFSMLSS
jgi:hypothetical protein